MGKWRLRLFWAGVLALVTALGVKNYLDSLRETVPVVVTAREIDARDRIEAGMLQVVHLTPAARGDLPADAFTAVDEVVGRYARRPIPAGTVLQPDPALLTEPDGVPPGPGEGDGALAAFLPEGTRALTLAADSEAVVGGQVRPGDRVDVLFTSTADATGGVYSSLVLQRVQVLEIQEEEGGAALVTVLVTPAQAVDLALAKRTGTIDLALSPPGTEEPLALPPASPLKFMGVDAAARASVEEPSAQPSEPSGHTSAQPAAAVPAAGGEER